MRGLVVLGVVLAACGGGATPPDADADVDGMPASALRVTFATTQPVPGEVTDGIQISRVDVHLQSMRAIGDAAPGDDRTTREELDITWSEGNTPEATMFGEAPAGQYSTVELVMGEAGGDEHAYRIEGQALIETEWRAYRILSRGITCTVEVPTATTLPPGDNATIRIDASLGDLVRDINFADVPNPDGGEILIGGEGEPVVESVTVAFPLAWDDSAGSCTTSADADF